MELHRNAALTPQQRAAIRQRWEAGESYRQLARAYGVNLSTVGKWIHRDSPLDQPPERPKAPISDERSYRQAVIDFRRKHPEAGPITIAWALAPEFPQARKGTVYRILRNAGLSGPRPRKSRPPAKPIPVGHHRVQMDVQQLPAIAGQTGFEYKISIIHTRTRIKYSEIHPEISSQLAADVLRRAMNHLPPFF